MEKAKQIGLVMLGIGALYAIMAVAIKFLADTSVSVNADLAASSNMAQYPGTSDFLLSSPWVLYFIPAVLGIIWIIIILRGRQIAEVAQRFITRR